MNLFSDRQVNLSVLRSEGNHEHIKQRLNQALEHYRHAGRVNDDAYKAAGDL
jgi:hypothetical protein